MRRSSRSSAGRRSSRTPSVAIGSGSRRSIHALDEEALPSRPMSRRLALLVLAGILTVGVLSAAPAGAVKQQAIPFTAATVTQTADGYDVKWAAPSSAGPVKVFAGISPAAV